MDKPPLIIAVLGKPGSGKGTQCASMAEQYGYYHLCVGDLVRAEMTSASELSKKMPSAESGKLVPPDIIMTLIQNALAAHKESKVVLLDGFPRSKGQADYFHKTFGVNAIKAVVWLDCSEEVVRVRLMRRHRGDDTEEVITRRLATYRDETKPLIKYYHSKIYMLDGEESVDDVHTEMKLLIANLLK